MSRYLLSLTRRPVAAVSEAAGVPSLSRGIRGHSVGLSLEAPRGGSAAPLAGWLRRFWYQPLSTHDGTDAAQRSPGSPKVHPSRAALRTGLRVAGVLAVLCLLGLAALSWRMGGALHASAGEAPALPECSSLSRPFQTPFLPPKPGICNAGAVAGCLGMEVRNWKNCRCMLWNGSGLGLVRDAFGWDCSG